jgi:phosphopantothenoylcysteine synthetase/decarboxylase
MTDTVAHNGNLDGTRVIVGLSGGIACYKVAHVVSRLAQRGAEVTVAMTEAATRFVTPLTFQALSGRPVYSDQWSHIESHDPQHITLARRADLMLIAPCTMDMLAKLAHGRTDDVVSLICSAVDRSKQSCAAGSVDECGDVSAAIYAAQSESARGGRIRGD